MTSMPAPEPPGPAQAASPLDAINAAYRGLPEGVRKALVVALRFVLLLAGISTLLFFLLRLAGDPIILLAGEDAPPETVEAIRAEYGFDRPLFLQYLTYLSQIAQLNFGDSLASGRPALEYVLARLPATLLLTSLAMALTLAISFPLGAWLGEKPDRADRKSVSMLLFVMQGVPGFVTALLLVQVFVVQLNWLPSLGYSRPATWILPSLSLASFLVPKLVRIIAANTAETMSLDFVRTARANGASPAFILWREVLPNSLLGAMAFIGAQFAFLVSGVVLIESIFLWPGLGLLILHASQTLDFPVLQAATFVIAALVFIVNSSIDALTRALDPRLRVA